MRERDPFDEESKLLKVATRKTSEADVKLDKHGRPIEEGDDEYGDNVIIVDPEEAAQNMITRNLSIELRRRAKGIICVALHPGTVDTGLSRPFQGNVPEDKLFSPDRAARQLLNVINGLVPKNNGSFLAWDAQPIPW